MGNKKQRRTGTYIGQFSTENSLTSDTLYTHLSIEKILK